MIFGFHAVTSRLRHEAQSVEEIFVDAERNDAKCRRDDAEPSLVDGDFSK